MGAILDALHHLQTIESQLRSVREQIESKKRSVHAHQRKVATIDRQISDIHQQIRTAQSEADKMDLDRKTHEQHVAKMREALNKAKTNKEYAAILTQLNTDKADAAKTEDLVLAALTKVDELKKQESDQKAGKEKELARGAELEKAAADVQQRLASKLADLEGQRAAAGGQVPKEVLMLFERSCEAHEGEGLAAAERIHPKRPEYICSGCNMSLTLETINTLQSKDIVVQCQTCSRILYLDAPAHASA
jgi:predicted  nucleic acid-binding Zn-ribbon protein